MLSHAPDCSEMELLLQADLDGELDAATSAVLTQHIMQCKHCANLQKQLSQLQRLLRDETLREQPSAAFRDSMRQRLLSKSSSSSLAAFEPRKKLSAAWKNTGLVTAGAALAAAVILTLLPIEQSSAPFDPLRANALMQENVVTEHVRSLQADHLLDVASTDHHTVKPWFNGKLDFVPPVTDFADAGFALVGGRLDYLAGRNVAALVYRHGQHPINLFVWPSDHNAKAAASCSQLSGYYVCSWQKDTMNFWAVSDAGSDELQKFVALWN